jgi:hypothetical protein
MPSDCSVTCLMPPSAAWTVTVELCGLGPGLVVVFEVFSLHVPTHGSLV